MTGPLPNVLVAALAWLIVIAAVGGRRVAHALAAEWLEVLLAVARSRGVTTKAEAREVAHDTIAATWEAIATGRYRPTPTADRGAVLLGYMTGATWKIADRRVHERRARRGREVSFDDDDHAPELPVRARDPTGQIEARSALERLHLKLSARDASLLVGRAMGLTHDENGVEVGIGEVTARQHMPRIQAAAALALAADPEERAAAAIKHSAVLAAATRRRR